MPQRSTPGAAYWIGSSLEDLRAFPRRVQREIGRALRIAQLGGKHGSAKPLKGFKGAGLLEVKKSKSGIKTPKHVIELIKSRLREAERDHRRRREAR